MVLACPVWVSVANAQEDGKIWHSRNRAKIFFCGLLSRVGC